MFNKKRGGYCITTKLNIVSIILFVLAVPVLIVVD